MNDSGISLKNCSVFEDDEESEQDVPEQNDQTSNQSNLSDEAQSRRVDMSAHNAGLHLILMRASRAKSEANFFMYNSIEIQRQLDQMEGRWPTESQLDASVPEEASGTGDGDSAAAAAHPHGAGLRRLP